MSYNNLGNLCQGYNGLPFNQATQKVPTILLSNYGGASYASPNQPLDTKNDQFSPYQTAQKAYKSQTNPYASAMCGNK
jgi:hypothetical protein